jgi:xanthosine utilization system XapX-like protein
MTTVLLVVLAAVILVGVLVALVRDPDPPAPATLEGGRSHMRHPED